MMNGKRNRRVGHDFERKIAQLLRDMGYENALTSRQASRLYDDCKLDIWGVPFNIQTKKLKTPQNSTTIIRQMKKAVEEKLEAVEKRMHMPWIYVQDSSKETRVFIDMSLDDFKKYFSSTDRRGLSPVDSNLPTENNQ
jgi:hypothetical protein